MSLMKLIMNIYQFYLRFYSRNSINISFKNPMYPVFIFKQPEITSFHKETIQNSLVLVFINMKATSWRNNDTYLFVFNRSRLQGKLPITHELSNLSLQIILYNSTSKQYGVVKHSICIESMSCVYYESCNFYSKYSRVFQKQLYYI